MKRASSRLITSPLWGGRLAGARQREGRAGGGLWPTLPPTRNCSRNSLAISASPQGGGDLHVSLLSPWAGHWRRMPNFVGILLDQPINRERPNVGDVENRFFVPVVLLGVSGIDLLLAFPIGIVVCQQHVVIPAFQQRICDRNEKITIFRRKIAAPDHVQRELQFGV